MIGVNRMKKIALMLSLLSVSTLALARPELVEISGAYKSLDENNQYRLVYISEYSGDGVLYLVGDQALPYVLLKCPSFDKPCKKFKAYVNWYPADMVEYPFSMEAFIVRVK